MEQDVVIYPRRGKKDPAVGPVGVMVVMNKDMALIKRSMDIRTKASFRILNSRLYSGTYRNQEIAIVGPMLGAPHAVMLLENLTVLGVQKILFFGWCGSIQQGLAIGDIVVADSAVSDEGTSAHYPVSDPYPGPSVALLNVIEQSLKECSIPFRRGTIWSTDAPYRETKEKILFFQRLGVLGVDMELSALFTVASFRQVEIGALLVVSDELGSLRWKPGFSTSKFNRSRSVAANVVPAICRKLLAGQREEASYALLKRSFTSQPFTPRNTE